MNDQINLLKSHKDRTRQYREKTLRILRIVAVSSIVFVGLFSAFLFFLQSRSPLPALVQKEAKLVSNLSLLHTKRTKFMLSQQRTQDIVGIVEKRYRLDEILEKITAFLPQAVSVGTFSLNRGDFTMTVSSSSLSAVDILLSRIIELSESAEFIGSVVTLDGFTVDPKTRQYAFSLHMQFR